MSTVFSEFVFVVVIVQIIFFHDVQLYRIEPHDLKLNPAFLTGNAFALVGVRINVYISLALRTYSSRHFVTSNKFYQQLVIGASMVRRFLPDRQQSTRACRFLQHSFSSPFAFTSPAFLPAFSSEKATETNVSLSAKLEARFPVAAHSD